MQQTRVWMWQSTTTTITPRNASNPGSDVLVTDELSRVLQHTFTPGCVQTLWGTSGIRQRNSDFWRDGPKPLRSSLPNCKPPGDALGPLTLWHGVRLREWLASQTPSFPPKSTALHSHCFGTGSPALEGWDVYRHQTFLLMRSTIFISESLAIFE